MTKGLISTMSITYGSFSSLASIAFIRSTTERRKVTTLTISPSNQVIQLWKIASGNMSTSNYVGFELKKLLHVHKDAYQISKINPRLLVKYKTIVDKK